ncbi:type I methionyl aminopeptidase [Candidatus Bipolaricaulota bacterium]|nr:type I methionyl aminopeptidase [Candidatus Bipolaricaulota bacterium]
MIAIKSEQEIAVLRDNGKLLAEILAEVMSAAQEGVSTLELDELAERRIREAGAEPAFKGYRGYPATLCTSINEEVVHGIPSRDRVLCSGDLLSVDVGLEKDGLFVDMATTVAVGAVDSTARKLLEVTKQSLWEGISQVTMGNRLSDVSHAIGSYVEREGFYVVREYVGHGIGRKLHEDPQIPNYGPPGQGPRLKPGMVLAIEPMVKVDPEPTKLETDDWTVTTGSGGLAVHFEHTVLVTETFAEVLTRGGE